jgi:hypothetical protein
MYRCPASAGSHTEKSGLSGLFLRRAHLPEELRLSRAKLERMAEELLETSTVVLCLAPKSTTTKWLDVPGGRFAEGRGVFREGSHKPQSFVAKYEGGERRIDVVEFLTVCQAIGVDSAGLGFWHTHRDFRPRLCT